MFQNIPLSCLGSANVMGFLSSTTLSIKKSKIFSSLKQRPSKLLQRPHAAYLAFQKEYIFLPLAHYPKEYNEWSLSSNL